MKIRMDQEVDAVTIPRNGTAVVMSRSRLWGAVLATAYLFMSIANTVYADEKPVRITPVPTPTIDRLAAPPTVVSPTQADEGAQLYWLNCQPCHGDRGQGLTDEWRAQFPQEDQNCWQSGCHSGHGKEPPPEGFILPTAVPALIGEGNDLARFGTLAQVYHYMRARMPYNAPGGLPDEEYLAIAAFLAQAHGIWNGTPLTLENLEQMSLELAADSPLETALVDGQTMPVELRVSWSPDSPVMRPAALGAGIILIIGGGMWIWRKTR